jgi:hypothetical protein
MKRPARAVAMAVALLTISVFTAHALEANGSRLSFRVEEAELDLGTVVAGKIVTATFIFHNDGAEDVHIIRAKPS